MRESKYAAGIHPLQQNRATNKNTDRRKSISTASEDPT
jgi:hypothetical protein